MRIPKLKILNEAENSALNNQWIEYANIYLKNITPAYHNTVLNELNIGLSSQSYLGGNTISKADEIACNYLSNVMAQLSFQEKERLIHLSRWYNAVQSINKHRNIVKFSRTPLYNLT